MDSRGNIRYFIGAQVDCSGLVKDCSDLDGLLRLVERDEEPGAAEQEERASRKDEVQELSQMFNGAELDTVRKSGGRMHREYVDDSDSESLSHGRPRLLLQDPTQDAMDRHRDSMASSLGSTITREKLNGKLEGVYQHVSHIPPSPPTLPQHTNTKANTHSTSSSAPPPPSASSSPPPPSASRESCNPPSCTASAARPACARISPPPYPKAAA